MPPGWPVERGGYSLYPTPRGLIYATSPTSAGWMDRYLSERLAHIQDDFDVLPGPGVFVAIGPDDAPMTSVTPWPVRRQPGYDVPGYVVEFPSGPPEALGFTLSGEYRWACALPTDDFNAARVDYPLFAMLRESPIYTVAWLFLIFVPGRPCWLEMAQNERDLGLTIAALGGMDLAPEIEEKLRARVYKDHADKRTAILRRYRGRLMK